jgi:Flp pilus assembly protein TadG
MSTDRNPSPQARFARDERGAVLVLWALFLAVAFGFLALAFDLGRLATTQTQLQSFADQVALAAAGELDGRPGARARATAAANGLIDGQQTYAQGAQALDADDFTLVFLSNLPANDRDAATAVATNDASARFVRVVVDRRTVLTPFANVTATLNGNARISADVGAEATAGFSSYACDITPLFFCVPNPSWRAEAHVGIQVEAVSGSAGNGLWTPGNFGFLDPTILPVDPTGPCRNLNGAQLYRCLVGAERGITTCIETTSPLQTRPGQAVGLTEAFNARFDIFDGPMNSYRNNASYRPAPNVLSDEWSAGGGQGGGNGGGQGGGGTSSPTPPNLPKDSCIAAGSCRFGSGDWDRDGYLSTYHGSSTAWPIPGDPKPASELPSRSDATRYDIYLSETRSARARNDAGMLTAATYATTPMGRPGNHVSARTAAARASLDPERRVVIAAAVDCTGQSMNGRSNVTALEYVKLFMTEPVRSAGSDSRILAEIVGSAGGIGSGAVEATNRDFIQLYR